MRFKIIMVVIVVFISLLLTAAGLAFYFLGTERGSRWVLEKAFEKFIPAQTKSYEKFEHSGINSLRLKNIVITNLDRIPPANTLRIQEFSLQGSVLRLKHVTARIINGRLTWPMSEPVFIDGTYKDHRLDVTVFSKVIELQPWIQFLNTPRFKLLKGRLTDIDVKVTGDPQAPDIQGYIATDQLRFKNFHLADAAGWIKTKLTTDEEGDRTLEGDLYIYSGDLTVRNTVIHIRESKITFVGHGRKPVFEINGTANIDTVKINVHFKGDMDKPELELSSDPPMNSNQLLLMLATNKRWKGIDTTIEQNKISLSLVQDFIDYAFFNGSGEQMGKKWGITDLSVTADKDKKGFGVRKSLTDRLDVGYDLERTNDTTERRTNQRLSSELKITPRISVDVERELRREQLQNATAPRPIPDDKIYLKYKTNF